MLFLSSHETAINIPGPAGNLEGVLGLANPDKIQTKTIGIVCHPHPLRGGTMNNKIVTTVSRMFSELGLISLRFNFRGIGKSAGQYGDTVGETEDLLAIIQWALNTYPGYSLWLAGFSFGSYISARVAAQFPTQLLLSIGPPVHNFDFAALENISCPWIVVQGDKDEIVPAEEVYKWINSFEKNAQPQLIRFPNSTHFFHGQLTELKTELTSILINYLPSY